MIMLFYFIFSYSFMVTCLYSAVSLTLVKE